jgi:hypothetical protein
MASMTRTRRIVIATVVLAVASTVIGVVMLASRPMSSAMHGMDMSASSPAPATADHGEMAGMDMSGSTETQTPTPKPTPTPTPTMDPDMPGMEMPASTPEPTSHGEMPGMDMPEAEHGSGEAPEADHDTGDMPGMEHDAGDTAGTASDRPLGPVLGTFGGGSAAVLLTAGLIRRKDRAANLATKAAHAARRTQK